MHKRSHLALQAVGAIKRDGREPPQELRGSGSTGLSGHGRQGARASAVPGQGSGAQRSLNRLVLRFAAGALTMPFE